MPGSPQSIPPLDCYSEAVRRQLYDLIEASEFTSHADEPGAQPQPLYSAEDAQFSVSFLAGRWFAQQVPDFEPEAQRVVRVKLSDESPWGCLLRKC